MLDLEFALRPSLHCFILLISLLILSILILIFLPIHFIIKCLAILFTTIYGCFILRRHVLLTDKAAIIAIRKLSDGRWLLHTRKQTYEAELCGESTITSFVSVLLFRVAKHFNQRVCILFKDSLLSDEYRKLVVTLKTYH